jgi:hypothetical protein
MHRAACIAGAALALLLALPSRADTVVLKNGRELDAKVLEQNETTVLLEVEYGTLRLERDKILRIEPGSPVKLAGDAAGKDKAPATAAAPAKPAAKPNPQQAAQAPKKKSGAAAAQANPAAQSQPSWADQYLEWRRTHRLPNGSTPNPNAARDLLGRSGLQDRNIGQLMRGVAANQTGRARIPSSLKNLPANPQDLIGQYFGGTGQ